MSACRSATKTIKRWCFGPPIASSASSPASSANARSTIGRQKGLEAGRVLGPQGSQNDNNPYSGVCCTRSGRRRTRCSDRSCVNTRADRRQICCDRCASRCASHRYRSCRERREILTKRLPSRTSAVQRLPPLRFPADFHCSTGKDHIGVFAALLLRTLSASD